MAKPKHKINNHSFMFKCLACHSDARVPFKRAPDYFQPTAVFFTCPLCESKFTLTLTKPKGQPDKLGVLAKLNYLSPSGQSFALAREHAEARQTANLDESTARSE